MYERFGLTLMVTQECNLACRYCYITTKPEYMTLETGEKAIERAVNSVKKGGLLELGFFGGEPFLASDKIVSLIKYAKELTKEKSINLTVPITTNGTILNDEIWSIITKPFVYLSVSLDGRPETHNRNRYFPNKEGSFDIVIKNVKYLLERNLKFGVVTVVGPETVNNIQEEIEYLRTLGIGHIELSLDIWSSWDSQALEHLKKSISSCAEVWINGLPDYTLSWYDDKAAQLTDSGTKPITCGFGKGDITVTPSGRLYPCERLVEDDIPDNPMRLKGGVFEGDDFLFGDRTELRYTEECIECGIKDMCNTTCGCCNYVRSGKVGEPDQLLCLFNQWTLFETKRVLEKALIRDKGESGNGE